MLPDQVERVVARYLGSVDAASPGLIEALYLVGSVALDDFQPEVSDVDFIAVTCTPPDGVAAQTLTAVHAQLGEPGIPIFEGQYVTFDELRASPSDAAAGLGHHDGTLSTGRQGRSPVEWTTLARHGITLRGPDPAALDVFTDPTELAAWTLDNLDSYWTSWVEQTRDPQTGTARTMLTDWGIAWGVLGVSRLHYTLATGQITSKSGAGRHALEVFGQQWHPIIGEALRCRPHPLAPPESLDSATSRRQEATAFMEFAIETARSRTATPAVQRARRAPARVPGPGSRPAPGNGGPVW